MAHGLLTIDRSLLLMMNARTRRRTLAAGALVVLLAAAVGRAQPGAKPGAPSPPAGDAAPKDALGRDTPRGTLLGFMDAARRENDETAVLFLNTNRGIL